jgi:hypothetical protein
VVLFEISAIRGKAERTWTCTLEEIRHQLEMTQTFKILKGDNVNKSTWFTPASEGQVRVTRKAADPLNVRQQASRLDIRKQFYSQSGGWVEQSADRQKNVKVNSFKMSYKKHRGELQAAT